MATSIDQKTHIRTALRVPPELHAQIHEAAAASGRSFNAEIVHRLEESFTRRHASGVRFGPAEPTLLTATPDELAELIAKKLMEKK